MSAWALSRTRSNASIDAYNGRVKKVFPPCMLMHVHSVNYPGTSQVDFCLYSI
jgi:hypothetical protein